MVVYLCHIESVIRSPILPARESGHSSSAPEKESRRSRHVFGSAAWRVVPPSCSLCKCSSKAVRFAGGPRSQRGLHCQTAQELSRSSAASGSHPGNLHQRLGRQSFGATATGSRQPWVERELSANWQWNFSVSRIVGPLKRWRKLTICWSRCLPGLHR